jgi:hypothetical protein
MALDLSALSDEDLDAIVKGKPTDALSGYVSGPKPVTIEEVDRETGAGFMDRIAAGFKSSPESAANFYRQRFGVGNVRVRNNEVEFINPSTSKWTMADPARLEMGDIADLAGDAPEIVLGAVGGILGGTGGSVVPGAGTALGAIGGAAGGTALGNIFKQIIGSALPGEDAESMSDRAINVVQSGALGAVGEGVGKLISAGILKPIFSRIFKSAVAKNPAASTEARAIERAINRGADESTPQFRFTPGEETGNKTLQIAEDVARTGTTGAETMYAAAQSNLRAMQDKAFRMVDDLRGGQRPMSEMVIGQEMKKTYGQITDLMQESLEARAERDFAKVFGESAESGKRTVFHGGTIEAGDTVLKRPLFTTPDRGEAVTYASLAAEDTRRAGAKVSELSHNATKAAPVSVVRDVAKKAGVNVDIGDLATVFDDDMVPEASVIVKELMRMGYDHAIIRGPSSFGGKSMPVEVLFPGVKTARAAAAKNAPADTPVFEAPKFKDALKQMVQKDTNSAGVAGARADGAQKLLDELPETLAVKDIQLYLQRLGRVGYGKGDKGFMERLGDTDRAKDARRLFSQLSEDLDDLASRKGTRGSRMAADLLVAKNNFQAGITEMDNWTNGYLAKVVGEFTPESSGRILDNMRKLNGDELKSMMTVVNSNPTLSDQIRSNWVEKALREATEVGKNRAGANSPWFNAKAFLNNLGTPDQIQAMFGKNHREVLADITMLQRAVARMSDRAFVGESPSAGRAAAMRLFTDAISPTQWPHLAKELIAPWRIAKIMTQPGAREQLERIASAKAPTRRVAAAITYLLGAEASQSD